MTPQEYTESVLARASTQYHNERVQESDFRRACIMFIGVAEHLDMFKKILFYGKTFGNEPVDTLQSMPPLMSHASRAVLHGALGAATEAGELVAAILSWLDSNANARTNLIEEVGDIHWYLALMQHGMGQSHSDVWAANDRKLAVRYGERFSAKAALSRNTEAEREALDDV